jgi:RNA recognition motif-containing protein
MGDLAYWMGESYLLSLFASTGEVLSAKIIRNKVTGYSEGYGFVEFTNNLAAQKVLQTYNGVPITGTDQFFKLNWLPTREASSMAAPAIIRMEREGRPPSILSSWATCPRTSRTTPSRSSSGSFIPR